MKEETLKNLPGPCQSILVKGTASLLLFSVTFVILLPLKVQEKEERVS